MRSSPRIWILLLAGVSLFGLACPPPNDKTDAGVGDSGLPDAGHDGGVVDAGYCNPDAVGAGTVPVITIQSYAYSPAVLSVPQGALVCVVNNDTAPHSVTSEANQGDFHGGTVGGVGFSSGAFGKGVKELRLPDAGSGSSIWYFCTVHGNMMGEGQISIQ